MNVEKLPDAPHLHLILCVAPTRPQMPWAAPPMSTNATGSPPTSTNATGSPSHVHKCHGQPPPRPQMPRAAPLRPQMPRAAPPGKLVRRPGEGCAGQQPMQGATLSRKMCSGRSYGEWPPAHSRPTLQGHRAGPLPGLRWEPHTCVASPGRDAVSRCAVITAVLEAAALGLVGRGDPPPAPAV